jgi:uncharacterized protein DUF4367
MMKDKSIYWEFLAFTMLIALLLSSCTSASTTMPAELPPAIASAPPITPAEANAPLPTDVPYTIAQVEELAGFDVREPAYLPEGVSFDFATFETSPHPNVILHFKFVHETYGDMGAFFQIVQEPQSETLPNPAACKAAANDCETLQVGDVSVNYFLTSPTESLMWDADGFSFQLLRTAGEPNKIYKDELLKVVGSME